ncbi:MAG TPA: hypothetical protein VGM52_18005 [Herbaspirillum sp.]
MLIAFIAPLCAFVAIGINYWLNDRVRNDIDHQMYELEKIKVGLSEAAQHTAEINASTAQQALILQNIVASSADRSSRAEEIKLASEIATLGRSLRPNIIIQCHTDKPQPRLLHASCDFKNIGAYEVVINLQNITASNPETREDLNVFIPGHDHYFPTNAIAPGGIGNSAYYWDLSDNGRQSAHMNLVINFQVNTEAASVAITKRSSKGLLIE